MNHWDFQFGWVTLAAAVLLLGANLWLSVQHVRRASARGRSLGLETLRLLVVLLICFTLLRPEHVRELSQVRQPDVVVLLDHTGSMATEDVESPGQQVQSRRQWLAAQEERRFWEPLEAAYRTHVETFGPPETPVPGGASPAADAAPNLFALADGTDLDGVLQAVLRKYRSPRAVLLVSDGDWNAGQPPVGAATQMRLNHTRLYGVGVGSDQFLPDLVLVDVKAPAFALHRERVSLPFHLRSRLPRDVHVRVQLRSPAGLLAEKEVQLPAGGDLHDALLWQANELGDFDLTLAVPVLPDEKIAANNQRRFHLNVRQELLRVLVVESLPRWEYRYLRNALSRDPGVKVDCLLLLPGQKPGDGNNYIQKFPGTREELSAYDVVFLGDVGLGEGELSQGDLELLKGLVEQQGSGLVFLPGPRGRLYSLQKSPLGELLPVLLDEALPHGQGFREESRLALTALGEDHLLTMLAPTPAANRLLWENLPGFFWNAAVLKARPGADVLAVHSSLRNTYGRLPLLVTRPAGNGNTLFMGTDAAWRWRKGVEDTYHYRFWGQVTRWMAHRRHLAYAEGIRVFYTPENPKQGDTVFVQATVFDRNGFPFSGGDVVAEVKGPGRPAEHLAFSPLAGGWGVYSGSFVPQAAGEYRLALACAAADRQVETRLMVGTETREKVGQPARPAVLADLARITDGEAAPAAQLDEVVRRIALLPTHETQQQRLALWCQWWWGLGILALCAFYWTLRKLFGLI